MAYEDAYLTKNFKLWMGGNVSGATNEEAASKTVAAAADLVTTIGATADVATQNGWTEISTGGWGFVAGNYSGPTSELVEQDGSSEAVYRQDLEVTDLSWNFQIDVNEETLKIFGGLQQKRRRFIVGPNGASAGASIDQFAAWASAPTQDNRGRQQYNISVALNGPVSTSVLS